LDLIPINALVTSISKVVDDIKPNTIYIPNRSDIHSDHRKTFESAMSACKSFRMDFIKKILMYECLSETEFASSLQENAFSPNYFVDISKYLEEKINILKVFKSELREFPFPRSEINIRALASYRGATANVKAAEAFVLIKEIA
ncbi:MAG: PIG-L family deacetylase, partial [Candidatus Scalindua sp.]|nr:PIG-L family deacetylase [Candidatus Scalindua sp.]